MFIFRKNTSEIINADKEPVAIFLRPEDKKNITNMQADCNLYVAYPDSISDKDVEEWIVQLKAKVEELRHPIKKITPKDTHWDRVAKRNP